MTKTRIACASVGVLCLVAAALLAWWITPSYVAQVPDGKDLPRTYVGTFQTLLNPTALAQNDLLHAVESNVPLSIAQDVKVQATSGGKALISDSRTTSAAGTPVEQTKWQYAVDRQSLEAVSSHPSSWNVVPAQGLTVSWPFGAQKKTYQGWVPETQTTTPLTYVRQEKMQGITTYVYQAKVPPTKIVDSQILATLPKALPVSLLKLLATAGSLPAAQAAQLAQILPELPDPVPLAYTFQDDSTFWADPTTGLVINVQRTQQRDAEISLPTGQAVPLLPVAAVSYQDSAASSEKAADDAIHGRTVISWLGVWLPIILLIVGFVLLVVAGVLTWLRRKPTAGSGAGPTPTPPATPPPPPTPPSTPQPPSTPTPTQE